MISKILRGYSRQLPVDSFFKLYTQMSSGHLRHSSPFFVVQSRDWETFLFEKDLI